MVAKSFQSMTQLCEPFESEGRMYVKVRNEKTKNERVVRWYTEQEYNKMYGIKTTEALPWTPNYRKALGFEKGYITIFKDSMNEAYQEFFSLSNARYHRLFGWYVVSTQELPEGLPKLATPIRLPWELVAVDDTKLKTDNEIRSNIRKLLNEDNDDNVSYAFGEIGTRYDITATVTKIIKIDNTAYGPKIIYFFEDAEHHIFKWFTAPKDSIEKGNTYTFRGTVKGYDDEKGSIITVLTRCMGGF